MAESPENLAEVPGGADRERRRRLDRVASWAVSAGLHVLLFALFIQVTWLVGFGVGEGEPEVGIVVDTEAGSIEAGEARLAPMAFAPGAGLEALEVEAAKAQLEPIEPVALAGLETPAPKMEALLGVDLGAGSGPEAADWSSFGGAAGGTSAGGQADFYGLTARGKRFVFVLDHSGSMEGAKLAAAKHELTRSITAMERQMEFFIIFYNQRFDPMPAGGFVKATEANKRRYLGWVETVGAGGGTDPTGAMRHALALEPRADAVWLLSDGLFADEAAAAIRKANVGAAVQVHTIAFYDDAGEALLSRIAEENRGRYRFVSPADLGAGRSGTLPWRRGAAP